MKVGFVGRSIRWAALLWVTLSSLPSAPPPRPGRSGQDGEREDPHFDKADAGQGFYAQRRAPTGETAVRADRYAAALKHMRRMPVYSSAQGAFRPGRGRWDSL